MDNETCYAKNSNLKNASGDSAYVTTTLYDFLVSAHCEFTEKISNSLEISLYVREILYFQFTT